MKLFLTKAVLFLVLLFSIAFLVQSLIDRGLKKDNSGDYREWNDIFWSRINADILIQGSSRAYRHISPRIIDSAFASNSYNLGMGGYGFFMQYYRFLFYLEHNKSPKYILQNVDPSAFVKQKDLFGYLQFLPYLHDSLIAKAVTSYNGIDWKDIYIPLFKYRSNYHLVAKGLLDNVHTSKKGNEKYKGFNSPDSHWDTAFANFKLKNPNGYRDKLDKETITLFEKFLDMCKTKGITVVFIYTPEYYQAQQMLLNRDSIMNIFRNYSTEYHIPFLDYSKDSICFDTANFYNSQHLNRWGVKKFDAKLVSDLKGIIK